MAFFSPGVQLELFARDVAGGDREDAFLRFGVSLGFTALLLAVSLLTFLRLEPGGLLRPTLPSLYVQSLPWWVRKEVAALWASRAFLALFMVLILPVEGTLKAFFSLFLLPWQCWRSSRKITPNPQQTRKKDIHNQAFPRGFGRFYSFHTCFWPLLPSASLHVGRHFSHRSLQQETGARSAPVFRAFDESNAPGELNPRRRLVPYSHATRYTPYPSARSQNRA